MPSRGGPIFRPGDKLIVTTASAAFDVVMATGFHKGAVLTQISLGSISRGVVGTT
jgi:hypothetical protein